MRTRRIAAGEAKMIRSCPVGSSYGLYTSIAVGVRLIPNVLRSAVLLDPHAPFDVDRLRLACIYSLYVGRPRNEIILKLLLRQLLGLQLALLISDQCRLPELPFGRCRLRPHIAFGKFPIGEFLLARVAPTQCVRSCSPAPPLRCSDGADAAGLPTRDRQPITPRQLAGLLRPFNIIPGTIWLGGKTAKG
jgi:hypothetical protein